MAERAEVEASMWRLLETAGVRARSVRTDCGHGALHHLEAGAGRPLVLLHGGTGGGANWFRLIGPLSARWRVLAPDLPGFGLSDAAAPARGLGAHAGRIVADWLERVGAEDALVVGTSFGGLAAVRCAERSPRASRLLLLNAAGLGTGIHPAVRIAVALPFTRLLMSPSRLGTRLVFRMLLTADRSGMPPDQQELLCDFLYRAGRRTGAAYLAETLRRFAGPRGQREVLSESELRALRLPVAIVWGERDRLLPPDGAGRAARLIPGATLRLLPQSGHSPNWEHPQQVIDAIEALAARPA